MRQARSPAEVQAALDLRQRVFCEEQGVALEADQDGRDGEALHVVAYDGDRLVGTCRLVFDGEVARLGRLAVQADRRGHGIGADVVDAAERAARRAGSRRVRLHAQTAALSLYERAGYEQRGERFLEEGIEHVTMEKTLA